MSIQGRTSAHGRELNDPTRLVGEVAAILSIGAGVIHYSAAGDHTNLPVMLAGFIVVGTLQVALGALLLWRRRPSPPLVLAGIALMVGAIGVWLLSRTEGLPFLENGHTEPIGFKDGVTVVFELASIPALLLLLSRDLARVSLSPRFETQTLTALGVSCFALMVPALMLGGGEHHSHEEAVEMGIHTDDHGTGEELAHADSDSHGDDPDDGHHAPKPDGKGHDHARSGHASGEHHSGVELASAPLHAGHEHDGGGDGPRHHADGDGESDHQDGHHRRDRPDRDHGHGDHEKEEPGGGSGDEPPISLTYEPEPSVCITTVCVP